MSKKDRTAQVYKTETQLKEEALKRRAAEAEASTASPKSALQKKRENFWYHYKWHTVAGVIAAFLIVFFIRDTVFRAKPDATVIVVGESFFSESELALLTDFIEGAAEDFNGDRKVIISADFISLPKLGEEAGAQQSDIAGGQQEMANGMKLMVVLAAGAEPIYLLDAAAYDYIVRMSKTDDAGGSGDIFEAFSVPAEKLNGEIADIFKGTRFYLRSAHKDEPYYAYCRQLLENLNGD